MKTNSSFFVLLLLLLFVSCEKEKYKTVYVPSYLKQMLPYKDGQKLHYSSNYGLTIETIVSVKSNMIKKSACTTCDPYIQEEYIEYTFNVGLKTLAIISVDNRPNIFMDIFSPHDNYQIGAGFDFWTIEGEPKPMCNVPRQLCLNTVTLNGKTHMNVLEITGGTGNNQLAKAYHTVEKGLIGFSYGNGNTFALVE